MLPTQLFRLTQDEALPWLLADYAGRLLALGVILALPAGRWVMRQAGECRIGMIEAGIWVIGMVALFLLDPVNRFLGHLLPDIRLGQYPAPQGSLYLFDLTFGLALVAFHEEVVFRKLASQFLSRCLRSDLAVVLASALLFAAYHWWTGIGNMTAAFIFGVTAMLCYLRAGSLWPVGIAHYLADVFAFA
jgi:membrane protease YdiL (CAAX protease family)